MYTLRVFKNGMLQAEWTFQDNYSLRVDRFANDPQYAIQVEHTTDVPDVSDELPAFLRQRTVGKEQMDEILEAYHAHEADQVTVGCRDPWHTTRMEWRGTCPNCRGTAEDEYSEDRLRSKDMYGHKITPVGKGFGISVSVGIDNDGKGHAMATLFHESDGFRQALMSVNEEGPLNVFPDRYEEVMEQDDA